MSTMRPVFMLRETTECPYCKLTEFLTESGDCRKCGNQLGVEFVRLPLSQILPKLSGANLNPLPMQIGKAIRELRRRRGISQEKLARAAGNIARSQLCRIECGHVQPPLSTLLRVTGALGLNTLILRFENAQLSPAPRAEPHS